MSERIHALAQHVLGKSTLEECSLEELQQLTKRYPFFAPGQFLLLQKLKALDLPEAEAQLRKAVLYYHDPLLFDHFLLTGTTSPDELLAPPPSTDLPEADEALNSSTEILTGDRETIVPVNTETTSQEEHIAEPQEILEVPQTAADPTAFDQSVEAVMPDELEAEVDRELADEEKREDAAVESRNVSSLGEAAAEPSLHEQGLVAQEPETKEEAMQESIAPAQTKFTIAVAKPADGPALSFEPFHTVDYFASQGIKMTVEELPKDKLGKQVRSFTEWLKVMKRLPSSEISKAPESTAEKTVENMASHSVQGSEVLTEAMAEVWTKQGNRQKAIDTYNKLSLLNPSKKAYFAAKIENLKQS